MRGFFSREFPSRIDTTSKNLRKSHEKVRMRDFNAVLAEIACFNLQPTYLIMIQRMRDKFELPWNEGIFYIFFVLVSPPVHVEEVENRNLPFLNGRYLSNTFLNAYGRATRTTTWSCYVRILYAQKCQPSFSELL